MNVCTRKEIYIREVPVCGAFFAGIFWLCRMMLEKIFSVQHFANYCKLAINMFNIMQGVSADNATGKGINSIILQMLLKDVQ
jgi:hypothetical protein